MLETKKKLLIQFIRNLRGLKMVKLRTNEGQTIRNIQENKRGLLDDFNPHKKNN